MEPFIISEGDSPVIAAAIHEGHLIRDELLPYLNLEEHERSREEDPYTDYLSEVSPSRVIVNVSRFETDLNRPRSKAVYQQPEDAWGLQVWKTPLPPEMLHQSLETYDAFYRRLDGFLKTAIGRFGHFALLDLHTYNHRREIHEGKTEAADAAENPEVNMGTAYNLPQWKTLIQKFITTFSGAMINGKAPDVRENVKFKGGEFQQWVTRNYGKHGLVLSIEFKKTFMDEHTGIVDIYHLRDIRRSLRFTVDELAEELILTRNV